MSQWQVEYSESAVKWLQKADKQLAARIYKALAAVAATGDPRIRGKALTGILKGKWRYRVGNIRIICEIKDNQLVILALEIGKRDHIYS